MPDGHRRAMPQVTAVDELLGTHTVSAFPVTRAVIGSPSGTMKEDLRAAA
jgi:hypothetical protein